MKKACESVPSFVFYVYKLKTFNFQLEKIASSHFFYYLCSEFGELGLNPENH